MALGYALLHPQRVTTSLLGGSRQALFDDGGDILLTMASGVDFGDALDGFLATIQRQIDGAESAVGRLLAPGGALHFLRGLTTGLPQGLPDLDAWIGRLLAFLEGPVPTRLAAAAEGFVDQVAAAVPLLDPVRLVDGVREWVTAMLSALEARFLSGRRDVGAARSFRAAVGVRTHVEALFADLAPLLARVSIRDFLARAIHGAADRVDPAGLARGIEAVRAFREHVGGLLSALGGLSASLSVTSAVDGPQPAPGDTPTYADDALPTPHAPGHVLWWFDLLSNIVALFNGIWELVRTAHWHRPLEVIISLLQIAWQATRTVVRAACPLDLNGWSPFWRWIFTDMGDFAVHFIVRFLASLHDAVATPNFFLSTSLRIAKYYTYQLTPRLAYLFARSWWYLTSWGVDGGRDAEAPLSLTRLVWIAWPVSWLASLLFGCFIPWDEFDISEMSDLVLAGVVISGVVFVPAALMVMPSWLAGRWIGGLPLQRDWGLFWLWAVVAAWIVVLVVMMMVGVNQLEGSAWIAGLILGVLFVGLFLWIGIDWDDEAALPATTPVWLLAGGSGMLAFGILPCILGMYYVDDGRDKHDVFAGRDPETSPYRLPYPAGDSWMCGQGNHGPFSHVASSANNHYSYDFNEDEDAPAWAARGGIVVRVVEREENGTENPNSIIVQHLAWAPGHDPGTDDERVLTYTNYWHFSQRRVWTSPGQRVPRGVHFGDIDDTGISAQHHLHFGADSYQMVSGGANVPLVFGDAATREFRNYPLLTWIPGHGEIEGKPISMAFYKSSNASADPLPVAMEVATDTGTDAARPHVHVFQLDFRSLPADALPESLVLRSTIVQGHFHEVTLPRDALDRLLRRRDPGVAPAEAGGHTHGLVPDPHTDPFDGTVAPRVVMRTVQHALASPPPGALLALDPGPYDLRGEQLVLRVNDRATEFHLFGAHRPRILGEVALDRGPGILDSISIGPAGATSPVSTVALCPSVRQAARELNTGLDVAAALEHFRPVPVLVLESRTRGRAAAVEVRPGTAAEVLGLSPSLARGTGVVDDLGALGAAQLAPLFQDAVNGGWGALPAGLTTAMSSNRMTLHAGGDAVGISGTPRLAAVLGALYRHSGTSPAASTPRFETRGPMPLSTGSLVLDASGTTGSVPILGLPARVELDPADAALTGDGLTASPLTLRLRDADAPSQSVRFLAEDTGAPEIARRIEAEAEGVRAWVDGTSGRLVVETVAAGIGVQLRLDKAGSSGAFPAAADGRAPEVKASAGSASATRIEDTTAIQPAELRSVIQDAQWRGDAGALPAAGLITAEITGDRLVLRRAGGTLEVAEDATGLGFAAVDGDPEKVETEPLSTALSGLRAGWIDLVVDGSPRRVALDAEPARLDGAPMRGLPRGGETLVVAVDGGGDVTVTFGEGATSVASVATEIARAVPGLSARVAYRLVAETRLAGGPSPSMEIGASDGLAAAGFLGRPDVGLPAPATGGPPFEARGWGFWTDPTRVPTDLDAPPGTAFPVVLRGPLVPAFAVSEEDGRVVLTATQPHVLTVESAESGVPVVDPLGLASPGPAHVLQTVVLPDLVDLGRDAFGYRLRVSVDTTPTGTATWIPVAETVVQFAAAPACLATRIAPELARLPADAVLGIRVTEPPGDDSARVHEGRVDLAGSADLVEVAERIQTALPAVAARIDRLSPITLVGASAAGWDRLSLETRGAGTGWRLELDNPALLAALGFDPESLQGGADTLAARGRGDCVDGSRITRSEIGAVFQRAARGCTQVDNPRDPTSTTRDLAALHVVRYADRLELVSAAGPVTLETFPPELRARLAIPGDAPNTVVSGDGLLELDPGVILVKVAARTVAAAELVGGRAAVVSPDPLPTAEAAILAQLAALHDLPPGEGILVEVDGGVAGGGSSTLVDAFPAPGASVPAGEHGFEEVVARLAATVPDAAFAVVDRGGAAHLRVESRRRGAKSEVQVDLSSISGLGPEGLLGFPSGSLSAGDAGAGNVDDLDAVSLDDLKSLLDDAADRGAGPQAMARARVEGDGAVARLVVTAVSPDWGLTQVTSGLPAPGGLVLGAVAGRGDAIESPLPAPLEAEPGLLVIEVTDSATHQRHIRALVWGFPARLPAMDLPADPMALDGKSLTLVVDGTPRTVAFTGEATAPRLVAQVERGGAGGLRARIRDDRLEIETRRSGAGAGLELHPGPDPAADARGALGIAGDAPLVAAGRGNVQDLSSVSAAEIADLVNSPESAFIGEEETRDSAAASAELLETRGCRCLSPYLEEWADGLPGHLRLASGRSGCMSSVIPLVSAPSLRFDRSLERGPAVGGSITLGPIIAPDGADGVPLPEGVLVFLFNEAPPAADFAPPVRVSVPFPAGTYDAAAVARRIHEEVFQQGVGCAASFPDGTVVVEALIPGIAGSVVVPDPDPSAPSTDAIADALCGVTAGNPERIRRGRGWPAGGGYRSAPRAPSAGTTWRFRDNADLAIDAFEVDVTLQDESLDDLASRLHQDLGAAVHPTLGTGRIGTAAVGPDGCLYVEATPGSGLFLTHVNGAPPVPSDPEPHTGLNAELPEEPGLGLRRTDDVRTVRVLRGRQGTGADGDFDEMGWIRVPTNPDTCSPAPHPYWVSGRYRAASRAEAARTTGNDATSAMVASAGSAAPPSGDPTAPTAFIHRARYWVSLGGTRTRLLGVRQQGEDFLVEFLFG